MFPGSGSMEYTRISADCHIDLCWLPPTLFTDGATPAMKSRMPYYLYCLLFILPAACAQAQFGFAVESDVEDESDAEILALISDRRMRQNA